MVSFKIDQPTPSDPSAAPARSPRRRVLLNGTFQSFSGTHRVAVRNLSCTGAAIECEAELKKGVEGVLATGGLDCLARVVWSRGGIYGLKFDEPLPNAVVLDLHSITREQVQAAEKRATHKWYYEQAR